MEEQKLNQINDLITKLENKDFTLYFFTLDTKGNPTAGIANIYEHVKVLNELGYKASILHEKSDYKLKGDENGMGITEWLGKEYAELPHICIEGQNLNIGPADFIIIPEVFSTIMDQIKAFPCRKIVFSQSYDYLLELLPIGKKWNVDYGFNHVITTSQKQADYINTLFQGINTYVVPVSIPTYFVPSDKPKIPMIAILTRNQGDAAKIAKSFYLQYPLYKWLTFKELRGLSRKDFAEELKKYFLAVWLDEPSGFGTFPIEAMKVNTPVIGRIPNLTPEWMQTYDGEGNEIIKSNGIWTNTSLNIPLLIASYVKLWFEDNVPQQLFYEMAATAQEYQPIQQWTVISKIYGQLVNERINEFKSLITEETKN